MGYNFYKSDMRQRFSTPVAIAIFDKLMNAIQLIDFYKISINLGKL